MRSFGIVCACCAVLWGTVFAAYGAGGDLGPRRFLAQVAGPTLLVVSANGIPIPLRLAGVTLDPLEGTPHYDRFVQETKRCIEDDLMQAGGKVRISVSRGYDYRQGGTPAVYAYVGRGSKEILLNELPITKGLAYHSDADSRKDSKENGKLASAQAAAKKQGLGVWESGIATALAATPTPQPAPTRASIAASPATPVTAASPPPTAPVKSGPIPIRTNRFYAEEGATTYYPGTSAWVKKINPKRLREFETEQAAKAAGMKPFYSHALVMGGTTTTSAAGRGKLVGLKTDKHFHGPLCVLLKKKPESSKIYFDSYDAVKKTGRTPCRSCLRLENPGWQQPAEGECIARVPPYFRHCLAKTTAKTRLCNRCAGMNQ